MPFSKAQEGALLPGLRPRSSLEGLLESVVRETPVEWRARRIHYIRVSRLNGCRAALDEDALAYSTLVLFQPFALVLINLLAATERAVEKPPLLAAAKTRTGRSVSG